MAPTLAFILWIETEMDQGIMALTGFHHNVATAAAVAAGGAPARDELLPAKGHASIATVPGLNPDDCFINKHAVYIDCTGQDMDSPPEEGPARSGAERQHRSLALVFAHGRNAFFDLFFAHNLFLRGDVPVVAAAIADARRAIAIELIGGRQQRACPGFER